MPTARSNPHDRLIKWVLTRPAAMAVELRHVLPARLCARLDWSTIAIVSGNYVDPTLDERFGDILCTVDLAGPPPRPRLYFPVEHQTLPDRAMPRRFVQHTASLWHQLERDRPSTRNAPPYVIPIVLHPGPRPWTHPHRLSEILHGADDLRDIYCSPIELTFLLDDLTGSVLDDPLGSAGIIALVQATRDLLRWARRPSDVTDDRVAALIPLLERVLVEQGPADIRALWTYIVAAFPDDCPLESTLYRIASPPMQRSFTTTYDRLLAKGRADGEAKGIVKGKVEALLRLIDRRGLYLTNPVRQRIETCIDTDLLHLWIDRSLTASTVEEILAPPA